LYSSWKAQQAREDTRILTWMNTGIDPEGTSGVGIHGGNGLPGHFALYQNYPNPFNPTTLIQYSLPVGTRHAVSLRVYDLLGREVAVLVDEQKVPGSYSVAFNARGFASGVYFYRLRAGGFVETRKLILLR
jgi:hypothetical protein